MRYQSGKPNRQKISPNFASLLKSFEPERKVRVVIVIKTRPVLQTNPKPQDSVTRKATVSSNRKYTQPVLKDIDIILERFGGERLTKQANALGSILVETTPAGVLALAESKKVKAIREDPKTYRTIN